MVLPHHIGNMPHAFLSGMANSIRPFFAAGFGDMMSHQLLSDILCSPQQFLQVAQPSTFDSRCCLWSTRRMFLPRVRHVSRSSCRWPTMRTGWHPNVGRHRYLRAACQLTHLSRSILDFQADLQLTRLSPVVVLVFPISRPSSQCSSLGVCLARAWT